MMVHTIIRALLSCLPENKPVIPEMTPETHISQTLCCSLRYENSGKKKGFSHALAIDQSRASQFRVPILAREFFPRRSIIYLI